MTVKDAVIGANVLLLCCVGVLLFIAVNLTDVEDRLRSIDSNLGQIVEDGTILRVPPPQQEGI